MLIPQFGDILIRNLTGGRFEVVDIVTGKLLAGPFQRFAAAVAAARARDTRAIWQQHIDDRGRALGDPFRLPSLE
jgi:hypothetical protein